MLRRLSRPLLAAGVATTTFGCAVYFTTYYGRRISKEPSNFQLTYRVRDSSGKIGTAVTTIPYISEQDVDKRIGHLNTQNETVDFQNKRKWLWHTAQLSSNDPIEDALAYSVVKKPQSNGNTMFFAVMDGHGGPWTSRLLSKILIPSVALELELLRKQTTCSTPLDRLKSFVTKNTLPSFRGSVSKSNSTESVAHSIQQVFEKIDKEILEAPLRYLKNSSKELLTDPLFSSTLLPARSGSCALLAVIDTANDDLYIASTGDCRAVAGFVNTQSGEYSCDELTEDQTGSNPREAARIRAEHPNNEAENVIKRGRVLGGLEPSRAFGDSRYKWSKSTQEEIAEKFNGLMQPPFRSPPLHLYTPPYVTCKPEVTYRKLSLAPLEGGVSEKLAFHFLILATDGLWDELSSKEVVALVSGHLKGLQGSVPKSSIMIKTENEAKPNQHNAGTLKSDWIFKDENIAAHLIRNAFGNTKEGSDQLRKLLSISPPLSRRFRDDTSVLVLWWESSEIAN